MTQTPTVPPDVAIVVQAVSYAADGCSVTATRQLGADGEPDTWLFPVQGSGYAANIFAADADRDATGAQIVGLLLDSQTQFAAAQQALADALGQVQQVTPADAGPSDPGA